MDYLDDAKMNAISLNIAKGLHGLPVGQARAILENAKLIILSCSDVDIHNPRFMALDEEGS